MAVIKSNKPTKDGRCWYFYDRYEIDGKIKQYPSQLFMYKREAEKHERMFLDNPVEYILKHSKKAKKKIKSSQNNTTKKILNDYFEDFCKERLKYVKSASVYENKKDWNNHLSDFFGKLTPEEINLPIVKKWHEETNEKTRDVVDKKSKIVTTVTYTTDTKNKWHFVLSTFFSYLGSYGLLDINYAKQIGQFKNPNENINKTRKIKYQTIEEFEFFMNEIIDDHFWYVFFNFVFWHGCRIGEQRALKISDIDFENDIIHFHKTFSKTENGGEKIGPIKNNKERYIFLAEQSKQYLLSLINKYKQMDNYSDDWFLFGGPLSTNKNRIERRINKYYDKLIAKYPDKKINRLKHHEFGRHSHASYLLNKGMGRIDIYEIIAQRLGDTVEVVRTTYAHPYEDENNQKTKEILKL